MIGLFSQSALLHTGSRRFTDVSLPHASLQLWEGFFDKEISDRYYHILVETTPWAQYRRNMYDKVVRDPRLTAWYGSDDGNE